MKETTKDCLKFFAHKISATLFGLLLFCGILALVDICQPARADFGAVNTSPAKGFPFQFGSMSISNFYMLPQTGATPVISNYNSSVSHGIFLDRTRGTLTNSESGWYRCFFRVDLKDDPATSDAYTITVYTNLVPVSESICEQVLISTDLLTSGLLQTFSAEVIFFLPGNTRLDLRVGGGGTTPTVNRANFNLMKLQ